MSYESDECKLLIDESIHDYLHDDTENEMAVKDWFYDLRKQAAKADEYEVKAKAFDDIREARKEVLTDVRTRGLKLPADLDKFSLMTERIINEYESGESDA